MAKKRNAVREYMEEVVAFGGMPMMRSEAIRQMEADGIPRAGIDRWLQGHDLARSRRTTNRT
jgi:hypothetical protein